MFQRFISFAATAALILAGMPVFISSLAQARFPRGTASASCPQATDNGCAAAPANGSFKNASLLTSAQQSGQSSLLPTRAGGSLTLNIPGVDYGIGPDSTLTPQDPRTINDGTCVYNGTGINAPPNDYVGCVGTGVTLETLNNYDFCGTKIGKATVRLYGGGNGTAGSTLTLTNNYFCLFPSTGIYAAVDNYSVAWGGGNGQNWNIVYKNNQCDGSAADANSGFCIRDDADAVGTSIDIRYNAFTNQGVGRIAGGVNYASFTVRYNFVQGLNDLYTGNHGELMEMNCTNTRSNCTTFQDYEGNFVIWNRQAVASVNNATFFPSDGNSDQVKFTSVKIINNISVNNSATDGSLPVGNGLFNFRAATYGDVTMTGNWLDAIGSGDCGISGFSSGNNVTASTSGNTINITNAPGTASQQPIEPGWMIFHSGFTTATITAYGTGTGSNGTYTFNGVPQALGSDSNWTVVPGFNSQTLSGNYLLEDPGHTGIPTAIGYSGPQFTATNCF